MIQAIAIASDHAGFALKERLKPYLSGMGQKVRDLGTYSKERTDYPAFAYILAKGVASGKFKRGIIICKSGIGTAIVANRVPGVRAALCYNIKAARLSRQHNDSNVLVLGSAFVDEAMAKRMVKAWLNTPFLGGRYKRRLDIIKGIEKEIIRG